ncbi:MAG: hypothetical protein AVDCRST_MAG51-267 [uncultured Ramlibacter sp.]|uniref:Uncharacterized protein n=1 Tax=uncultured Ramlibacter sp. TaxID=260755 RepID=A0A6J4NKE7_9BURK|nr:MAG: hypothetical protein AVDCRST_MAG51-267 [uncultured Ramlibacter sp.]
MNARPSIRLVPLLTLGLILAACGGGSGDPEPTPLAATLNVSNATNATLNGEFASSAVNLAAVEKINPIGGEPEVCSFRFDGLRRADGATLEGDIRYIPGNASLREVRVSINNIEFISGDTANVTVDRANNRVDLSGKTLTARTNVPSTIAVTGSVPMRGNRPEGC